MSATAVYQPFLDAAMPKYLVEASYTAEGAKGLMKAGGSARRAAVQKMVESLGRRLEAFFFTFGANDVLTILHSHEDHLIALAAPSADLISSNNHVQY